MVNGTLATRGAKVAKMNNLYTALADGCRAPCCKLAYIFSKKVRIMDFSYNIKCIKCLNF